MTAWNDEGAMRAYRNSGAHRNVMHKLLEWCDEASVAHWTQENAELPNWQNAYQRMIEDGRLSKVNHPSTAQIANQFPAPRSSRLEKILISKACAKRKRLNLASTRFELQHQRREM